MNKYKLYMILGIIVLVLSVGSSFAYYVWKSTSNALVSLNVCTPAITFAGRLYDKWSGYDTSKVTHMGDMLESCTSLTTLDLSSFNISNVTNTSQMFMLATN